MRGSYVLILILGMPLIGFTQNFKGRISFVNYYLDKQTMKPILPKVAETVWINDNFMKIDVLNDSAETGGIDWQVFNYKTGIQYSKEFYPEAKIKQSKICDQDTGEFTHQVLDTTIDFKGMPAQIMIIKRNGIKEGEFYYTGKFKMSPAHYSCPAGDMLNYFYRITKGCFLLQRVEFGNDYTWIYQAQDISSYDVSDKEFEIPAK